MTLTLFPLRAEATGRPGPLASHRVGEGAPSSLMTTFQRDGPQALEKGSPGSKAGNRLI